MKLPRPVLQKGTETLIYGGDARKWWSVRNRTLSLQFVRVTPHVDRIRLCHTLVGSGCKKVAVRKSMRLVEPGLAGDRLEGLDDAWQA